MQTKSNPESHLHLQSLRQFMLLLWPLSEQMHALLQSEVLPWVLLPPPHLSQAKVMVLSTLRPLLDTSPTLHRAPSVAQLNPIQLLTESFHPLTPNLELINSLEDYALSLTPTPPLPMETKALAI